MMVEWFDVLWGFCMGFTAGVVLISFLWLKSQRAAENDR
jgi:hypothetical protein